MIAYRPEIDGLRAVAIASVVLFHSGASAFSGGYVGVDIFFVISGYLITSIILKADASGGFSYLDFYARRARRILPALLAMTAIVTAVCLAVLLPSDLVQYGKILIYTILFGANFRLTGTPAYFDTASQENPLLHMWSLSVEEQFYLLWPTLLVAAMAFLSPRGTRLAVAILALASLVCAQILVQSWPKSAFYHLPSRGWELLAGAMLAMGFAPTIKARALAEVLSMLGLALMLVPVFLYDKETVFPGLSALPPVLGCALVIHAEGAFRTRVGALLSLPPVVFLGLISYSLYLWHWPVFALPSYVLMREFTAPETALLIALALVLGTLSWRFVERPFRKAPPKAATVAPPARAWPAALAAFPLTRTAYAAVALAAGLAASGSYFQKSKGAAWRLPEEVLALDHQAQSSDFISCAREPERLKGLVECKSEGAQTVNTVLWGDSHAKHYQRLIASVYGNTVAYLYNGCIPVLGTYVVHRRFEGFERRCYEFKNEIFTKILKTMPKIVILAGRWTSSEYFPYDQEDRPKGYFVPTEDDTKNFPHSLEVFENGLQHTVAMLTQRGIKVILMGQVPEFKVAVSHCLAIRKRLHLSDTRCFLIPRSEVERRQRNVNRILRSIASGDPNVAVYWPFDYFCDENSCYAKRDGNVYYRDDNHITGDASSELGPSFVSGIPRDFLPADDSSERMTADTRSTSSR